MHLWFRSADYSTIKFRKSPELQEKPKTQQLQPVKLPMLKVNECTLFLLFFNRMYEMHTLVSIWCCFIVILTTLQIINWMFWGVVVHGFSFLTFIDTCTYYTCFCLVPLALDIQWIPFDQICNKTKCLYAVWCFASSECWVMKRKKGKNRDWVRIYYDSDMLSCEC